MLVKLCFCFTIACKSTKPFLVMKICKRVRDSVTFFNWCFLYAVLLFVAFIFCLFPSGVLAVCLYFILGLASDLSVFVIDDNFLEYAPNVLIVTPTIIGTILWFSVVGWIGAIYGENKTYPFVFSVLQALGVLFEIYLIFWFMQQTFEVEQEKFEQFLTDTMPLLPQSWNVYQNRHNCCGVSNYTDLSENGDLKIPPSCCKPEFPDCARNRSRESICCGPDFPHCNSDEISGQVYEVDCQSSLESGIQDYKRIVLYAGFIVASIQLLPIFWVFYCFFIKQEQNKRENSTDPYKFELLMFSFLLVSNIFLLLFPLFYTLICIIPYTTKIEKDNGVLDTKILTRWGKGVLVSILIITVWCVIENGLIEDIKHMVDEMRFIACIVATIFSFVVYTTLALDFYGCFVRGKSLVIIGLTLIQHIIAIALQIVLLALYLKRGTYFEERVEGWLNDSINNYRENNGTAWDNFQHKFGCCGINNYTDWCNVTGLIPSSCCKPDFPNCDVLGEGTYGIFDAGCKTAVVSKIEDGLTGILFFGEALVVLQFLCFILEMQWKQKRVCASESNQMSQEKVRKVTTSHLLQSRSIRAEIYREANPNCRKVTKAVVL